MAKNSCYIMIGGEAGQGLATIGELLVKSLVRSGYHVLVTQDYMSRIRGGNNTFTIRASVEEIAAPIEDIDLLVALDKDTVSLRNGRVTENGLIVVNQEFGLESGDYLQVPYKDLSEDRYFNIAALGVVGSILGLDQTIISDAVERAFGKKHPETVEKNAAALENAFNWCRDHASAEMKLAAANGEEGRLAMHGNHAIALGAMAAGLKFCAFYPMTPSTSIALTLTAHAEKMGIVMEQAEDEIAAVNMAVGASFAGAPSMVTTSGGGFALMCEGVSLAGMTETPLVIAVVQRPGPSTGLPTRTEQADLNFVVHGGHGEFPRAVLAPGTVEQCFHLTWKAFDLAERYQTPVFILSDQFLADSYRDVSPFNLDDGPKVNPLENHQQWLDEVPTPYQRYALSENGISPRLLPCQSEHLVVADSDEHDEAGHITEDLDIRIQMNEKRLSKTDGMLEEFIEPEFIGDSDPDLLLVCWGSTRGAVIEAAAALRKEDRRTAVLHFSQTWPLNPLTFMDRLEDAGHVIAVESNASGQFAGLIRRECGFNIHEMVLRYDGLPITPDYILRNLETEGDFR